MLNILLGERKECVAQTCKEEFTMVTAKTPKAPEAEKLQKAAETAAPVKAEKVEKQAEKVEKKAVKTEKKAEKKPAAKQAVQKTEEVLVQFGGSEWNVEQLKQAAQDAYVADGHRASTIKKLSLYIKPEERMAYYVINDKITGSVAL